MLTTADTTAAPSIITTGRLWWKCSLLLSPLTLGDLGWYERMGGGFGAINKADVILLIWLSLRGCQPEITYRQCCKLFRRRRLVVMADNIIQAINPDAFKRDDGDDDSGSGGDKGGSSPHADVMRALAAAYQWGPDIVFSLTPTQANIYLSGDPRDNRRYFDSREEADAFAASRGEGG